MSVVGASAGSGTFKKVKVANFMCHKNLEVEFGPRINFIVGENGSGKSAVLTALCIALGMKASKSNRADKGLKGFVREGASSARLEVSIRNTGEDALDPDTYGDTITVERVINASGGASLKIKNQYGHEVGSTRDHLIRITDHFNIDVDNPIVVMSQDASRQFLHSGKDNDKYKFFVTATLLDDIQRRLSYVKGQVEEMDKLIKEKEADKPKLDEQVAALEEEAKSFQKVEELREKVVSLRNRLAWSHVYEAEQVTTKLEQELQKLSNETKQKLQERIEQQAELVAKCEEEKKVCDEKMRKFKTKSEELAAAKRDAEAAHKEADRKRRTANTEVMSAANRVKDAEQQMSSLEQAIANAQLTEEQQTQAQDAQVQAEIDEKQEAFDGAHAEIQAIYQKEREMNNKAEQARMAADQAKESAKAAETELRHVEQNIQAINSAQQDELAKFHRNMPAVVAELRRRENEFQRPPIGPFGKYIKLRDQRWARPVEDHIGGILGTFLTCCGADQNKCRSIMKQHHVPANVISLNYGGPAAFDNPRPYNIIQDQLPRDLPNGVITMMSVLEFEHPLVFNQVVDQARVEKMVLAPDEDTARKTVYRKMAPGGRPSPNVTTAFTTMRKMTQRGSGEFEEALTQKPPRLGADVKAQLAELEEQRRRARDDVASHQQARQRALDASQAAQQDSAALKGEKRNLQKCYDKCRIALDEAKAAEEMLKASVPAPVDVSALQDELAGWKAKLDEHAALKSAKETAERDLAAAAHAAHEELGRRAAAMTEVVEEGKALTTEHEAATSTLDSARQNLDFYQGKMGPLQQRVEEIEVNVQEMHSAVQEKENVAITVCKREEALAAGPIDEGSGKISKEHDRAKRKVEQEEQRHPRSAEEVHVLLADASRKKRRLEKTLQNAREPCTKLEEGIKMRQKLLTENAHTVRKMVSHRFNHYMAKKGHAGKVVVNYKEATLMLDVKMNGQGQTVKDTRSMSGGERSYSTLALTLSLGEMIESPFRAMDEFDVFMDAVNRKVSIDALVSFARDSNNVDKQFLFITPQDISAVDAKAEDILVQKMRAARP